MDMHSTAHAFIAAILARPDAPCTTGDFPADTPKELQTCHAYAERAKAYMLDGDISETDMAWLLVGVAHAHAEAVGS